MGKLDILQTNIVKISEPDIVTLDIGKSSPFSQHLSRASSLKAKLVDGSSKKSSCLSSLGDYVSVIPTCLSSLRYSSHMIVKRSSHVIVNKIVENKRYFHSNKRYFHSNHDRTFDHHKPSKGHAYNTRHDIPVVDFAPFANFQQHSDIEVCIS